MQTPDICFSFFFFACIQSLHLTASPKAQIINLYQNGKAPAVICTTLQREHDVQFHPRILTSRLKTWGVWKHNPRRERVDPESHEAQTVQGPNQVWTVNGFKGLEPYGIRVTPPLMPILAM